MACLEQICGLFQPLVVAACYEQPVRLPFTNSGLDSEEYRRAALDVKGRDAAQGDGMSAGISRDLEMTATGTDHEAS